LSNREVATEAEPRRMPGGEEEFASPVLMCFFNNHEDTAARGGYEGAKCWREWNTGTDELSTLESATSPRHVGMFMANTMA